ncbi:MAG: hypothetical protein ACYCQJ_12730 [Nitrososphaerales archaeon]
MSSWVDFKSHVDKWGYLGELVFRKDPVRNNEVRVRLAAGKYGLDLTLARNDPTLEEIEEYLKISGAKRIEEAREVLAFFS